MLIEVNDLADKNIFAAKELKQDIGGGHERSLYRHNSPENN